MSLHLLTPQLGSRLTQIKKGSAELELVKTSLSLALDSLSVSKQLSSRIQTIPEVQHVHLTALVFYSMNMLGGEADGQSR